MKKTTAMAIFLAVGAGAASASAALALSGSDTLFTLTTRVIATCPANLGLDLTGLTYGGGGSTAGEIAIQVKSQQVAPMSRALLNRACGPDQANSENLEVAGDALSIVVSDTSSAQCDGESAAGGLARSTTISLLGGGSYTLGTGNATGSNAWKDILRVLYAGRGNDGVNNCNSAVRRSIAAAWSSLFQRPCVGSSCTGVKHVWRRGDLSGTTDVFNSLVGLPAVVAGPGGVVSTPYCNGKDYDDNDPIRIPCDPADHICGANGTLGLLQSIFVPENLTVAQSYPTRACDPGVYNWKPAPSETLSSCPGGGVNVFTLCLMPGFNDPGAAGGINHQCLKLETNDTPFFTPASTDTRVFNQHLRNPNGTLVIDAENREVSGAFYRIRSTGVSGCREPSATRQIGCLARQYACTIGFAGQEAATLIAGVSGLWINGIEGSVANALSKVYPLGRGLYVTSIIGFENVTNVEKEANLLKCFAHGPTANEAASFSGFVPLNAIDPSRAPFCLDFNEATVCGASTNNNACLNNGLVGLPTN